MSLLLAPDLQTNFSVNLLGEAKALTKPRALKYSNMRGIYSNQNYDSYYLDTCGSNSLQFRGFDPLIKG